MTFRAVLIGLVLGLGMAAVGYLNDWSLELNFLANNLVPPTIFGLLLLGLMVVNPLLSLVRLRRLAPGEWSVIVSLMMVCAVISGPGLMWQFNDVLVRPHYYRQLNPGWQKQNLLQYAPRIMLVDPGDDYERVVGGFLAGVTPGRMPPPGAIPWHAWRRTLGFWMPLIALGFIAAICAAVVVHRQWAHRERLRYPVAEFASEILRGAGEGRFAAIFHNRRFWIGFAISFTILLINGLQAWHPDSIQIPTKLDFSAMAQKWPRLNSVPRSDWLLNPRFFFIGIAFAYFISSDVSLAVGINHILFAAVFLSLLDSGLDQSHAVLCGGFWSYQAFGAYVGMGVMILYVGRSYYRALLARVVGLGGRDGTVDRTSVWAARAGLAAAVCMVLILVLVVHLDWMLATLFVLIVGLLFLVLTRINAETGLIIIQPMWWPMGVLLGLFGINALGPDMLTILGLLSAGLVMDPRACMMPMAANALRLSERQGVSTRRLAGWMVPAVLLALVVGMFATIYVQYAFGQGGHFFWGKNVGGYAFEVVGRELPSFLSDPAGWHEFRISQTQPSKLFTYGAGLGLVLVLTLSFLRTKFTWWPVHPLLFLIWHADNTRPIAPSFLLGWFIKGAVTRFGGSQTYRRNKPLFVGLVSGEFLAAILWAVVALVYYLLRGTHGRVFEVFTL